MIKKLLFFSFILTLFIGCQFTETMVLNEDGSGTMTVEVNMDEMMAMGAMGGETEQMKMDTIVTMKDFLEEKKDSISKLSKEDQLKLKKLENYKIRIKMDSEKSEMLYNVSTKFKSVAEANDILNGLEQASNLMPKDADEEAEKEESSSEIIGVNYSFEKGVFKRDAYIKDKVAHQREVDSLKQSEAFLGTVMYSLKYTFPKSIKKVSDPSATLSIDKKTLTLTKPFVEYFKNPDLLDLEVEVGD
ncbi:MAG: hypothetical protein WBA61_02050 [Aequorivita sp.]